MNLLKSAFSLLPVTVAVLFLPTRHAQADVTVTMTVNDSSSPYDGGTFIFDSPDSSNWSALGTQGIVSPSAFTVTVSGVTGTESGINGVHVTQLVGSGANPGPFWATQTGLAHHFTQPFSQFGGILANGDATNGGLGTSNTWFRFQLKDGSVVPAPGDPIVPENFDGSVYQLAIFNRGGGFATDVIFDPSLFDSVVIEITSSDSPPIASAGSNFGVDEGQAFVMLDASGSSDPDSDPLSYTWAQTNGTIVALSDASVQQPTFTAPLVGIGGETLSFELTVTANGESATDSVDVTVDNLNQTPVVTITSPADSIVTNSSTQAVHAEVSDEDATTITSVPVGLAPTSLPEGGGFPSGNLSLALEGPNEIIVSAEDEGGLTAAMSIIVYRDTVAPSIVITPAEGTVVSTPIPSFGITVTDQTETAVSVNGTLVGTAVVSGGDIYGVSSVMLTGAISLWSEGANVIVVQALDAAGNVETVTRTVILDSTAPVVTILTPDNGACYGILSDLVEIPLVASVDDASTAEVTGALSGTVVAGGSNLIGTFVLQEGVNEISVSAQDNAGAGLIATDTVSVTLDTIAPSVSISTPVDGACVRGTIEFHASASDVLPGTVASSVFSVDGTALTASELYLVDTTLLTDGMHELRVDATDSCGNIASATVMIEVDNTLPEVSLETPFDMDWVSGSINFDANASDAGSGLVSITMRAANAAPGTDGSTTYAVPVAIGLAFSVIDTLAASGGVDGQMELEVTATDCAGNQSTVAIMVNVDNSAPSKALLSPADGSVVKCSVLVTAEVDDLNLESVQFVIDGEAYPLMTSAPFEMNVDTRERLDGDMSISLIATDLAGNVTICTHVVTVDNLKVKLRPHHLKLKRRGHGKKVRIEVAGQSAALLMDLDLADITLCVPGGSPIPATKIHGHEGGWRCHDEDHHGHKGRGKGHRHGHHGHESKVHVNFDRQLLIGALRGAGHTSGKVIVTIKATIDGVTFVLGTDTLKVKG